MKGFIKLSCIIFLLAISLAGNAQSLSSDRPKRISITLDVSGSMEGSKYEMANYAAQTLSVFSNPNDIVRVYYLGISHEISGETGYRQLQIPFNRHHGQNTYFEISDLDRFLKDFKPDPAYQDWLFIIGDGVWDYEKARSKYEDTVRRLSDLLVTGQLQVCYLQTGDDLGVNTAFTSFLQGLGSPHVDIRKSDKTAATVLDNCVYFANKILGFSNTGIQWYQEGDSCAFFLSEFPLERCLVVYQSERTEKDEVGLTAVSCADRNIRYRIKGNPSTRPLVSPGKPVLNCAVWELSCPQTIPANEKVKVIFNQAIDAQRLTLYPYVDVYLRMSPYGSGPDMLAETAPGLFRICDKEGSVRVRISVTDRDGNKFPPPVLQRMDVKLHVDGQVVSAPYSPSDTSFLAIVGMPLDTLSYFSTIECPGYFSRISSLQTVLKEAGVCPPDPVSLITLPIQRFDPIGFDALRRGIGFSGTIDDTLFNHVAQMGVFDEQSVVDESKYRYSGPVSFTCDANGLLSFRQTPDSDWCECAFPDSLVYRVILRSSHGIYYDGKLYEGFVVPVSVLVDKREWWNRCDRFVLTAIGILLFLIYLALLLRKKRFRKSASIVPTYYDFYGRKVDQGGCLLRKRGLAAWLNRWFVPGRERTSFFCSSPNVAGLTFIAADVDTVVNIVKSSINPDTMRIKGYRPDRDAGGEKYVKISNNDRINIVDASGEDDGYLTFIQGETKDGTGYRVFIILLMLAGIVAEVLIGLSLIKSMGMII